MPKISEEEVQSPKFKNKKMKKDKKQRKKNSKSDDDSEPEINDDMSTLEMQKFIQKMFPSKSGRERLRQLEKLDTLVNKTNKQQL